MINNTMENALWINAIIEYRVKELKARIIEQSGEYTEAQFNELLERAFQDIQHAVKRARIIGENN